MNEIFRPLRRSGYALGFLTAACVALPTGASAQYVSFGGRVSSLGFGAEVSAMTVENLGVRAGVNAFSFSFQSEEDDVDYDFDVGLLTGALLVDYYLTGWGFRGSAGFMLNGNDANMLAEPADEIEIGDNTYTREEVGDLTGEVTFGSVSPFIGIGLDTSLGGRGALGFVAEIGALFHNPDPLVLEADGPIADDPDFQADLETEREDVDDDIQSFTVYPVVALGVSYRF